jgi:hypothetical protein
MNLNKTVIDNAVDKKYTMFSDAIKTELYKKMSNHPQAVAYATTYDNVQSVKQKFAEINGAPEE